MQIKTNELQGAALDWAVAKANGNENGYRYCVSPYFYWPSGNAATYAPSWDWEQGGPIIERSISKVFRNVGGSWSAMILIDVPLTPEERGTSLALSRRAQFNGAGPTPLIAAMRCYVASKLGDIVEVPDELAG